MPCGKNVLRDAYLKPYYYTEQFVVKTQWSVFPLFLVLFIAGVILWFVMLKRYGLFSRAHSVDTANETEILSVSS